MTRGSAEDAGKKRRRDYLLRTRLVGHPLTLSGVRAGCGPFAPGPVDLRTCLAPTERYAKNRKPK